MCQLNKREWHSGDTLCHSVPPLERLAMEPQNCIPIPRRTHDLTGKEFGRWKVLHYAGSVQGKTMWRCKCACGTERDVYAATLKSGASQSCGCYKADVQRSRHTTHGMSRDHVSSQWIAMKQRCYNPRSTAYKHYGGRGIAVCARWRDSLEAFATDIGVPPGPGWSIDRIDNNGDYCPENFRWATHITQGNNRRNNTFITVHGITDTVANMARRYGIHPSTLHSRVFNLRWTPEKAVSIPARRVHVSA